MLILTQELEKILKIKNAQSIAHNYKLKHCVIAKTL